MRTEPSGLISDFIPPDGAMQFEVTQDFDGNTHHNTRPERIAAMPELEHPNLGRYARAKANLEAT